MDEQVETAHPARSWGGLWIWLGLILLFYVLSVGPAVRIHDRCKSAPVRNAIESFYFPLEALHSTPLRAPLDWWVRVWRTGL